MVVQVRAYDLKVVEAFGCTDKFLMGQSSPRLLVLLLGNIYFLDGNECPIESCIIVGVFTTAVIVGDLTHPEQLEITNSWVKFHGRKSLIHESKDEVQVVLAEA